MLTGEGSGAPPPDPQQLKEQTEALRWIIRPVLALCMGSPWVKEVSSEWEPSLKKSKGLIERYSAAVGLITAYDVLADGSLQRRQEAGTAIVVGPRAIVTNKHVIKETFLGYQEIGTKQWKLFSKVAAQIEFPHEYSRCKPKASDTMKARIVDVIYAPAESEKDFIILKTDVDLPQPVPFAESPDVVDSDRVAVIGYPGRPNVDYLQSNQIDEIFGTPDTRVPFPIARISLGYTLRSDGSNRYLYDATTWGGSSGSLVMDLVNGQVIALHADGLNAPDLGMGYNRGVTAADIAAWQKSVNATPGVK